MCGVQFSSLGGEDFLPPSEPNLNICSAEVIGSLGGLHLIFERDIQSGSNKHKKVKQALGLSLRSMFRAGENGPHPPQFIL